MASWKENPILKILIVSILSVLCIGISFYLQSIGFEQVYTHLFYIPIIISCIWWQRRGIPVALMLGIAIIALGVLLRPDASPVNNIFRAIIFVIISFFVSEISVSDKKKGILLHQESEASKARIMEIESKNKELEISRQEIAAKNNELEKINRISIDREMKMIELKARIGDLEKTPK